MAQYVVTGGAGFIGSNLVQQLLKDGHQVRVFDNFSAGRFPNRLHAGAEYVEGDIRDRRSTAKVMEGTTGVFHTAAVPRVPYSVEHPDETNEHNITGTLNVLLAARDAGVRRVVFSSSSSIYGGSDDSGKLMETLCPRPLSPYALQKLTGEHYCRLFNELYRLETIALRYFNVYGPYLDPQGAYALVVGKFLKQRSENQPLTICGDGEYFRDYTHVSDVVRANILAMTSQHVGKGEAINIGFGHAHSVNELARLIGGPVAPIPPRPGDARRSEADNSLAVRLLNWQPTISLEEGIKQLKQEWGIL